MKIRIVSGEEGEHNGWWIGDRNAAGCPLEDRFDLAHKGIGLMLYRDERYAFAFQKNHEEVRRRFREAGYETVLV